GCRALYRGPIRGRRWSRWPRSLSRSGSARVVLESLAPGQDVGAGHLLDEEILEGLPNRVQRHEVRALHRHFTEQQLRRRLERQGPEGTGGGDAGAEADR